MNPPLRHTNAEGAYCFRVSSSRTSTCTSTSVPSAAVEAEAKRFAAMPGVLTLYVVRHRWADAVNRVSISIDGRSIAATIPESLVRVRLAAGEHQVRFDWNGHHSVVPITGKAGEVLFAELVGAAWSWGSQYRWEMDTERDARRRALLCKLIGDLDLRDSAARG